MGVGAPREAMVVKRVLSLLTLLAVLAMSPAAMAAKPLHDSITDDGPVLIATTPYSLTPTSTKGPFYYQSENELRMRKFVRGVANIGLSVGEIPNQIFQDAYATSPVTGIFTGTVKGVLKGAKRIAVGAWEVVTFYHPGTNYYAPLVEPEVVFQEYIH